MQSHKLSTRLFFTSVGGLELHEFIDVFHRFIQQDALPDEVMIDVAGYAHVPGGPGVLLVCHEGHYVIEQDGDRFALVYNRKRGGEGQPIDDRVAVPLRRLFRAARALEAEPALTGRLRFATDELELQVRDRLHAPNTPQTWAALEPALATAFTALYGAGKVTVERDDGDPRRPITARVRAQAAPTLASLASLAAS